MDRDQCSEGDWIGGAWGSRAVRGRACPSEEVALAHPSATLDRHAARIATLARNAARPAALDRRAATHSLLRRRRLAGLLSTSLPASIETSPVSTHIESAKIGKR
jgi:hypothetical protein